MEKARIILIVTTIALLLTGSVPFVTQPAAAVDESISDIPDIDVWPTSIDFGPVSVNSTSANQTVTVSNVGSANLTISDNVSIVGPNFDQFLLINNVSGRTLAPSANATLQVAFSPTYSGNMTAALLIPSNDPDEPTANVTLSGHGVILVTEVWVDDDWVGSNPGDIVDGHVFGTDAFATIQDGIDIVMLPGTVHVTAGTYYESITLKESVQVLGAGANITIIDGSTARNGLPAYHVVVGTDNATLDGFTVTGGSANGTGNNGIGGGMYNWYSSPTVTNCTFLSNSAWDGGGGMVNWYSSPTVTNCTFSSNYAGWGGGMYNGESSLTVTNCTFSSNSAGNGGGGMYNHDYSLPTVTNCIFWSNSSTKGWGGGMHNHKSSPTITNCTFSSNSGGGMLDWDSSPTITNCIFWDNGYEIDNDATSTPLVTYCDIKGGYSGATNIDDNPLFVDPPGDDYHLQSGSLCIDKGTNTGAPTEDIEGNPRPIDGDGDSTAVTDMGAYEYVPPVVVEATVDFAPDTLNLKSKGNMVTIYMELPTGYNVGEIDVSSIWLNGAVPALSKPTEIDDYDSDNISDLMIKFDRSIVQGILEPGDEVEITVSGQLTDDTPFKGTDTIRVIPDIPDISVTPPSINFGSVLVGSMSANRTVTVSNNGTADLIISDNVSITGPNFDQFLIVSDNCSGQTLAPSANATLQVAFSPTFSGNMTATLLIPSNDPDESPFYIPLTGFGFVTANISISAYIDGKSLLIIRTNTVQWHHLEYAAPGRHGFENLPTTINGFEWYPVWPDVPDAENRRECYSSVYEDLYPALPESDVEVELSVIQGRYALSIAQYPSEDNGYTLIIEFNDNPSEGPAWYECELTVSIKS